jgi:hypothetical protein
MVILLILLFVLTYNFRNMREQQFNRENKIKIKQNLKKERYNCYSAKPPQIINALLDIL